MHPIAGRRGGLLLYLAGWLLLGGATVVLVRRDTAPLAEAAAVALPLALVFGFVALAAWYPCRATPLRTAGPPRVLATHLTAAALASGLWLAVGDLLARALGRLPAFAGAGGRYRDHLPALFAVGILFYLLAVVLHYLLVAFEDSRRAERRALELQVLAREAELRALRDQVNPHFLFNSLNSIAALAGDDPAAARRVCGLLADFLRRSLRLGAQTRIPLAEELAMAANLLEIERVRFGRRLGVAEEIEEGAAACAVPPLLLQPLVENAVTHGVAQLVDGGTVRIAARRAGDDLHLVVENPCDPERPRGRGAGLGLDHVRRRLEALYGPRARCTVAEEDGRFRAEVVVPVAFPADAS